MNAQTITRPTAITSQQDDVVNHWVPKAAITASLVNGEPARALCGSTEVLSSQGGGSVAAAGARTCPRCQSIYERLLP